MHTELRDALEFLYTNSRVASRPRHSATIDVARGAIGSVHILMNGLTKGARIRFRVCENGRSVRNAEWFRLVDVPVEANTGPLGFTEGDMQDEPGKDNKKNQYVTRRAPFRVFDAMEPVADSLKAQASTTVLRLHIPVGSRKELSCHEYRIELQTEEETCTLSFTMNVHRTRITAVGKDSIPYTNWFSFNDMAGRHGLEMWSPAHWQMIRHYADLMVHARQNTFWIPLACVFEKINGVPVLNRERLRRIVSLFTDAGMHFIEGGHVAHRTGGKWKASTFDISLIGARATQPEGNAALAHITRQLMEEIESNGWRDRWIQHVTDEPVEENAVDYRILVGMTRRHMPGIPILDATMDPGLVGSVDIWCPQCQEYQKHREAFEAQRALGDKIWFYTCCFPGGPWLNRLLDMELLRPALLGWGAALFNLDGFLHWGLNHYMHDQNPFKQNVVRLGGSNSLPPGDTHIVYPGTKGPWSSLRLEAQREGFEDLDLFRRLRARNAKTATRIISRCIRGFDDYTKNVTTFRAARKSLLDALDE